MKPGPKRSAAISAMMMQAQPVELDNPEVWVVEAQKKAVGKHKIGRPCKLRHPIEEAAEASTMSVPRLCEPVQSIRGLSAAEMETTNTILMFSYHTAILVETVLHLQRI
jgi:hypothetical protein